MSKAVDDYQTALAKMPEAVTAADAITRHLLLEARKLVDWQKVEFAASAAPRDPEHVIIPEKFPSLKDIRVAVDRAREAIGEAERTWRNVPNNERHGLKSPAEQK